MARLLTLLFFALISFDAAPGGSKQPPPKAPPVPELAAFPGKPEIRVRAKGTVAQVARIVRLSGVTSKVLVHPVFISRTRGAMVGKRGMAFSYSSDTGQQVLDAIADGAELDGEKDGVWNLDFEFEAHPRKCIGIGRFKKCTSWVLGWTNGSTNKIWINSLPWDERKDCGIVGTIVHEQLHKLGYDHPEEDTWDRPQSVPYAIGDLAADVCNMIK